MQDRAPQINDNVKTEHGRDKTTAAVIARIVGPLFATIGIGMLANGMVYRQVFTNLVSSYATIYLSGVMLVLAGLIILNAHNAWTRDWRSAVTLIGWALAAIGVWRLIAPQLANFVGAALFAGNATFFIVGGILVVLGGFLSFKGYVA